MPKNIYEAEDNLRSAARRFVLAESRYALIFRGELAGAKHNVMFHATRTDRETCLFLHCRSYGQAFAVAVKCATAIVAAGVCKVCSHEHVGKCTHVTDANDGFAKRGDCMNYPDHRLNHGWLDNKEA